MPEDAGVPAAATVAATPSRGRPLWFAPIAVPLSLSALLLTAACAALSLGRFPVGIGDVATLALGWLGVGPGRAAVSESAWRVVELVRLPRLLVAGSVGAGLALAGAALQGVFRNPLVDAHVIGVSSGAAFGGVLAILFGFGAAVLWPMAFAWGLGAVLLVLLLSRQAGGSSILLLVLSGIVVSALFAALVSLATYFANPNDTLPAIVFWLMGSFAGATPERAALVVPIIVVLALPLLAMGFRINVLSLGDEEAQALGLRVEPTRWLVLTAVTGITAAGVATSGMIGWVGLVVPHFARLAGRPRPPAAPACRDDARCQLSADHRHPRPDPRSLGNPARHPHRAGRRPGLRLPAASNREPGLAVMLKAEHLAFRFDASGPWLFRDLTFSLPAGRTLALLGPNGRGKTTC